MDIKDIKRAMDNMPMGDGSAFAEISVGPAKHEQFLDEHYGKVALVADFDDSRAAVTATYLQAVALWNAGKEDEGVARMKAFIDSAPTEEWKAQASVTLACRLMNRGKADEADGLFRSVVDAGDPTFSGFATMCLGDIARAKKDNAAAGAFYRELAEKFPSSAFVLQRGGYLLRKSLFDIQSPVRIEPAAEQK